MPECRCFCHTICTCELGDVLGSWQCRQHGADPHCGECMTSRKGEPDGAR